jgi:vacuole morphology and inheritance protein 14
MADTGDVDEGDVGEEDDQDAGEWIPGQGVVVDHAAIVEILLVHLSFPGTFR